MNSPQTTPAVLLKKIGEDPSLQTQKTKRQGTYIELTNCKFVLAWSLLLAGVTCPVGDFLSSTYGVLTSVFMFFFFCVLFVIARLLRTSSFFVAGTRNERLMVVFSLSSLQPLPPQDFIQVNHNREKEPCIVIYMGRQHGPPPTHTALTSPTKSSETAASRIS